RRVRRLGGGQGARAPRRRAAQRARSLRAAGRRARAAGLGPGGDRALRRRASRPPPPAPERAVGGGARARVGALVQGRRVRAHAGGGGARRARRAGVAARDPREAGWVSDRAGRTRRSVFYTSIQGEVSGFQIAASSDPLGEEERRAI